MSIFRSFSPKSTNTRLGGRYQLVEQLSAGGFGQTFIAEDLHLPGNPRCVIKRLQPQITDAASLQTAKRLFDTEAKVLYQLGSHDQIPRLLAHFEHEQEFYLAQELVVGKPLTQELLAKLPWTEAQVVALLHDILGVLTFVHEQDVIHRDIKPANLMRRDRDGKIVLIDFGAVKQVSTQLTQSHSKTTHTIAIGTPGYMPNEQLAGNPRFSSDVYAVGMLGVQALTGVSPRSLAIDPLTSEIQWQPYAPQVSAELAAVLDKMIRYDFRARYPTAAEALAAIAPLLTHSAQAVYKAKSSDPAIADLSEDALLPEPTTLVSSSGADPGQTRPEAASQPPPSDAPPRSSVNSREATEPLRDLQSTFVTAKRSLLTWLMQMEPRKIALSCAGLAVLGGAFVLMKPSSTPPSESANRSSAPSSVTSPSPTPDPQAQAETLLTRANQLRERKQAKPALDLYKQAIALNPKSSEAQWGRCYSLNVLEKFTEAIAACDAALKLNPNYAEALWSKGYALDRQQKDQQALVLYERAIALKPNLAEAWSNKGTALLQLDRPAEAVAAFDQATRLKPDLAEAWNNRGVALWSLRRFDEAIASVDQAIQIQPTYQDALKLRQQMRQRLGQ